MYNRSHQPVHYHSLSPQVALDLTQRQEVYLSVMYFLLFILLTQFNLHHILENTLYDLETGMYFSKRCDDNEEAC